MAPRAPRGSRDIVSHSQTLTKGSVLSDFNDCNVFLKKTFKKKQTPNQCRFLRRKAARKMAADGRQIALRLGTFSISSTKLVERSREGQRVTFDTKVEHREYEGLNR